jgi:hypothetical protein
MRQLATKLHMRANGSLPVEGRDENVSWLHISAAIHPSIIHATGNVSTKKSTGVNYSVYRRRRVALSRSDKRASIVGSSIIGNMMSSTFAEWSATPNACMNS